MPAGTGPVGSNPAEPSQCPLPWGRLGGVELPTLTGRGLTLRPKRPDDVEALVAACADPEIARWTSVPSPYRREHAEHFLAVSADEARAGTAAHLIAVDADDRLLGSFSVMELDRAPGYGEIGYWVAAPARGRGVATAAVRSLADWALGPLGLTLLEILCHEDNAPSRAVARRAGFAETGERRTAPRSEDPGPARYVVHRRVAG